MKKPIVTEKQAIQEILNIWNLYFKQNMELNKSLAIKIQKLGTSLLDAFNDPKYEEYIDAAKRRG